MRSRFIRTMMLLLVLCSATALSRAQQASSASDQVAQGILRLYSPSARERAQARDDLVLLGTVSVKPLLALLQDLRNIPQPRFNTGREKEGNEFIELYNALPMHEQDYRAYRRIDISLRLRTDVIELLGRLKDPAAIPALLACLEEEIAISPKDIDYPESRALIQIGAAAVPSLIAALEKAEDDPSDRGASMSCSRLAFVLVEIGDRRSLTALELIAERNRLVFGNDYLVDAIEKIRARRFTGRGL